MDSILSIDQGTSATKALLFSQEGQLLSRKNKAHVQSYPRPGWAEQDAQEIYKSCMESASQLPLRQHPVRLLALSNQRETVVVWDKASGMPIHPAIGWQCNRAAQLCASLAAQASTVFQKTGLVLSPYFSAAKIAWILDNVEGARALADAGRLLWGTIDSWLIWKWTGWHATDVSNASRTQLLNIHSLCWDAELSALFRIPMSMYPEILNSNARFGETDLGGVLPEKVPLHGVLGDSQAAMFGQGCRLPGHAKATYGTGSSVAMLLDGGPRLSESGLVTSVAWGISGKTDYMFEGNINCTGATIKWMVEEMELIRDEKEASVLASQVGDTGGVYLVPAFVGLGAPHWKSDARAMICGMTRGTTRAHVVRAAEESIAYQIKDIVDLCRREAQLEMKDGVRVDGGPSNDAFLMQFQADVLGLNVDVAAIEEVSGFGSALMAGLGQGLWSREEAASLIERGRVYRPSMDEACRSARYEGWKQAVKRCLM